MIDSLLFWYLAIGVALSFGLIRFLRGYAGHQSPVGQRAAEIIWKLDHDQPQHLFTLCALTLAWPALLAYGALVTLFGKGAK